MDATTQRKIETAMAEIPPTARRVLILVRFRGCTWEQTATQLHLPKEQCVRLYARATEHINKALQ